MREEIENIASQREYFGPYNKRSKASQRQLAFIKKLMVDRDLEPLTHDEIETGTQGASEIIELLLQEKPITYLKVEKPDKLRGNPDVDFN